MIPATDSKQKQKEKEKEQEKQPSALDTSGDKVMQIAHGHISTQGIRYNMEDEVVMYDVIQVKGLNLKVSTPLSLYGVFDGHGGKKCAEYTKAHLCRNIIANLENGQDASHALTAAYIKTDTDFCTSHSDTSGTTAVTVLVDQTSRKYWCANVGDSRAILARRVKGSPELKAIPLSIDHKPDRADELERIRLAGGFVIHKRVLGELAVSRAIGDKDFKASSGPHYVIAEPEITTNSILSSDDIRDEFIVIACDGLYDVMSNDDVVTFVANEIKAAATKTGGVPNLDQIANKLVTRAIDNLHTRDNVSVIIISLK